MKLIIRKKKPKAGIVYDLYWRFAAERQNVFFNKIERKPFPWTSDEVIRRYKFTNAYRASDRVSQYLIKNVIYKGNGDFAEVFFRTILFKTFNKIRTWEFLIDEMGELTVGNFSLGQTCKALSELVAAGEAIYSGAYIMASGKSYFGFEKKYQNHLKLIEMMLKDRLWEEILHAKSMEAIFLLLKSYPTIGNFLAYQYTIDLNYSSSLCFSEMDFVFPGPGARDGIRKCFTDYGDYSEADIIKYAAERQEIEFGRLGLDFKNLWGRNLQLIDCQNLFCEVDKYARAIHPEIASISGRKRIKQMYRPAASFFAYWYPPKWGLNGKLYGAKKDGKADD